MAAADNFHPILVPTTAVEIDWGHPLAQGLICLIIPGSQSGLSDLTMNFPTLTATSSASKIVETNSGLAFNAPSSKGGASTLVGTQMFGLSHALGTVHWSGDITSAASAGGCVFGINYNDGGANPYHVFDIALDASANVYAGVDDSAATTFYGAKQTSGWAPANGVTFTGTFVSGGTLSLFRNGASVATTAAPATAIGLSSTSRLNMANWPPDTTGVQPICTTRLGAIWSQSLSSNFVSWLNAEPFAMVRPLIRRQYYAQTAGTVYSASIAETGAVADTTAISWNTSASTTETGAATDVATSAWTTGVTTSESGSAVDATADMLAASLSVLESAAATDSGAAALQTIAAISETGTAGDTANGFRIVSADSSEIGSASDALLVQSTSSAIGSAAGSATVFGAIGAVSTAAGTSAVSAISLAGLVTVGVANGASSTTAASAVAIASLTNGSANGSSTVQGAATYTTPLLLPVPVVHFTINAAPPPYLAASTTPRKGQRVNVFSVAQVVNVVYAD